MRYKPFLSHLLRNILVLALLFSAWIPGEVQSAVTPSYSCLLEWNPNREPDLAGYKVHIGETSGNYSNIIVVVGASRTILTDVPLGTTLYLAISAYTTSGMESPLSDELVVKVGAPKPVVAASFTIQSPGQGQLQWRYPANTAFPAERFTVYACEDLVNWVPVSDVFIDESERSDSDWHYFAFTWVVDRPRMFFRVGASNAYGDSQ
jgi:hypothetical protein